MKIGTSESIEHITPRHWQRMAEETHVGWPMLRERIVDLCGACRAGVRNPEVLGAPHDAAMAECVASIVEGRTAAFLQSLR